MYSDNLFEGIAKLLHLLNLLAKIGIDSSSSDYMSRTQPGVQALTSTGYITSFIHRRGPRKKQW